MLNYHIVLTRNCNLNCSYCHGGEDAGPVTELQYSLDDLVKFIEQDESPQLMFYGGEPLLRIELMSEMMDRFPNARFMLQTNALLLNRVSTEYIKRFHSILVSIDGREEITDGYRSSGVYNRVIDNVKWLEEIGYQGDIVARMAVSQESDIYREVTHLLDLRRPTFKNVHWQLNVVWDAEGNWEDFDKWLVESYNPGITNLVKLWLARMQQGTVEGIVPFKPLMYTLLTDEESLLRCGAGLDTFAIHVDGQIGICPISPDWDFSLVGDIWKSNPSHLQDIMHVDEPCPSCDEFQVCGGRCLFANKQRLWGQEGFEKICKTVKHLINSLREILPDVKNLIQNETISLEDFDYPEFNNGCEIIP
ncbi:MAG: TIGR04084 family radical SAM/SPASM domain-containing protein [Candidatus Thorarchaeota archaeon]